MTVRIKYDITPEYVRPKLEDLDIPTVSEQELIPLRKQRAISDEKKSQKDTTGDYEWFSWSFNVSLSNIEQLMEAVNKFLVNLYNVNRVIIALLKIFRLLSGNVKSLSILFKYIIKALAKELKEFLESFASTGLYMNVIFPNSDTRLPNYTIPVYGGYQEFIRRVNVNCLSSDDPDAPQFNNDQDRVGGVIIAMIGGSNDPSLTKDLQDPEFLKDAVENFRILSKLFPFNNPVPSAPENLKARPGFYTRDGIRQRGVKLTWETPDTPVTNFLVYRAESMRGVPKDIVQDNEPMTIKVPALEPLVKIKRLPGKLLYSYIDFEAVADRPNYYKVYSIVGEDMFDVNPELEKLSSPVATKFVKADLPEECIPVPELLNNLIGINGELLNPFDFEGDWQSITVRTMLGNSLDSIFRQIDAIADKLIGWVDTGSDAVNSYLDFYERRISKLLGIMDDILTLINRILSYRLRGTFLVLRLPIEKGGMRGFLRRFNRASNLGDTENQQGPEKGPFVQTETRTPIAQFREQGIMFGVILLFGFPEINRARLEDIVPPGRVDRFISDLERTEKAVDSLLKLLGLA